MIEAKSDNGSISLVCRGNITDLVAYIALIVHSIYEQLPESVREEFKEMFTTHVEVMFMNHDEIDSLTKKQLKKLLAKLEEDEAPKAVKEKTHEN